MGFHSTGAGSEEVLPAVAALHMHTHTLSSPLLTHTPSHLLSTPTLFHLIHPLISSLLSPQVLQLLNQTMLEFQVTPPPLTPPHPLHLNTSIHPKLTHPSIHTKLT